MLHELKTANWLQNVNQNVSTVMITVLTLLQQAPVSKGLKKSTHSGTRR